MPCFSVNFKSNFAVFGHHGEIYRSVVTIYIYKRMLQVYKLSFFFSKGFTK